MVSVFCKLLPNIVWLPIGYSLKPTENIDELCKSASGIPKPDLLLISAYAYPIPDTDFLGLFHPNGNFVWGQGELLPIDLLLLTQEHANSHITILLHQVLPLDQQALHNMTQGWKFLPEVCVHLICTVLAHQQRRMVWNVWESVHEVLTYCQPIALTFHNTTPFWAITVVLYHNQWGRVMLIDCAGMTEHLDTLRVENETGLKLGT